MPACSERPAPDDGSRSDGSLPDAAPLDGSQADAAGIAVGLGALRVAAGPGGTFPYSASVVPLVGQVPIGTMVASADDPNMSASVLSTHADGSAALVVVAGRTTVAEREVKNLRLVVVPSSPSVPLDLRAVGLAVSSVRVGFGGAFGSAELVDFRLPERVWWANAQTICARFRLAAPSPSGSALEAVIDIQVWASGEALVEIVVENGRVDTAAARPLPPAPATYTDATVTVNGRVVATVTGAGAPEGRHAPFRAWYARAWLGTEPPLRVTPSHVDLQEHPLLFRMDQESSVDLGEYALDAYVPWTAGRQRPTAMGATGDHYSIGPLPIWEAHALQTGAASAWNATEVSALALLGYGVNHRDAGTGLVPTFEAIGTKSFASGTGWPGTYGPGDVGQGGALSYKTSHGPAAGLMAFLGRPSPIFIELAQKIAVYNGTWSGSDNHVEWTSGTFGYWYNVRGRAWGMRSLAHAMFLTPDGDPWRAACAAAIRNNVDYLNSFRTDPKARLNMIWDGTPAAPIDEDGAPGLQQSLWQQNYLMTELHKVASAGLLRGADQEALDALADWICLQPVRFVNEQPGGGWRFVPYKLTMGDGVANVVGSGATWDVSRNYSDDPATVGGVWMSSGGTPTTFSEYREDPIAGAFYPSYFWSALVAGHERRVAGSVTAMDTVLRQIANLDRWRSGFASDPRWGAWPRNRPR